MNRIVITGATSMIGTAIIRRALMHDCSEIYAVVRPATKNLDHLPNDPRITVIECAIDQLKSLPALIPVPCDVFYHIAWGLTGQKRNQDISAQAANIQYTIDAVRAAHAIGCKRFVGAGSQAEYGHAQEIPLTPQSPVNPVQPYGIAKYAAGRLAAAEAEQLGISCFWVRIFSVYGPFDKPSTMISSTIRKMLAKEHTSFTLGTQLWEYLYADDAGEAFYRIGMLSGEHRVFCLGSGQARPLHDFITDMRDQIDPSLTIGFGEVPYGPNGPLSICADISELTALTGWTPSVSFPEGIRKTISWMKGCRP